MTDATGTSPQRLDARPVLQDDIPEQTVSTRSSLLFVYCSYFFRYLYLLILIPFYAHVLGAAEYGKVLAAMSLFSVVWLIVNYGFSVVGTRNLAAGKDAHFIGAEFGRHLKARASMAGLGVLIGTLGTTLSPMLRQMPVYGLLATLLGILGAFNLGWYFQGTQRFRTSVLLEITGFTISLTLILTLVRDAGDGVFVLLSLLVSSAVTTAVAYLIALRQVGLGFLRFTGAWTLLRDSTAMFVSDGASRVMSVSSTFLLSFFASAEQVGHFGAAERFAALGLTLMVPANQVMISTVAAGLSRPEDELRTFRLMRNALMILGLFGIVMCVAALALSPIVIPLVLGPSFQPSVAIFQIFALTFPLAAFNQVIGMYILLPLRQDRFVARATLTGMVCNLLCIVMLASDFHGYGVAAARVMGELATSLVLMFVLQQQFLVNRIVRA